MIIMKDHNLNIADFKELLKRCLIDGLDIVKKKIEDEKDNSWMSMFDNHDEYPSISFFKNGLPSFYLKNSGKRNFSKIFIKDEKYLTIHSFVNYHDFIKESAFLKEYFEIYEFNRFNKPLTDDVVKAYILFNSYFFLSNFVDSYIHSYSLEFEQSNFEREYELYVNSIISKKLNFDIIVPILYISFDFENFDINESIGIIKMDNKTQLSRNIQASYTTSTHKTVIGAATHAFILRNWSIDNIKSENISEILNDVMAYSQPINVIEKLFAILRLISQAETGYCQIISRPTNSKRIFKTDLSDMYVVTERKYPDKFENYGWLKEVKLITSLELSQFATIFKKLNDIPKYEFATKKLNSASLRKNDEDSILDITSALESLLTNDSKSEITYRLSIRASQLCKIKSFNNFKAREVYELCKKIYDYRSAVIHGEVKRIEKTKKITLENTEDLEIIKISFDLLRHCLLVLLESSIDDIKAIDDILFK